MSTSTYLPNTSEVEEVGSEFAGKYRSYALDILTRNYASVMKSMSEDPLWQDDSRLGQLQEKYFYLRQYYLSGAPDPTRESFLREIGQELMHLLRTKLLLHDISTQPYHSRTIVDRKLADQGVNNEEAFVSRLRQLGTLVHEPHRYYPMLEVLFDYLWVGDISSEGVDAVLTVLRDEEQTPAGLHLLSALYLALLQCFDVQKLNLLVQAVVEPMRDAILGTALPILLLIGRRYPHELQTLHPDLVSKVQKAIATDPHLNDATYQCIIEVYHTYSTTRDHQIFSTYVVPKLEELKSRLDFSTSSNIAEQIEELSKQVTEEETNELQSLMESASQRMEDFDATGHDVEYHTMKEMKTSTFFDTVSHWFLPYDPHHPVVDTHLSSLIEEFGAVIFKGRNSIISSDLYSVATFPHWATVLQQLERFKDALPHSEPPRRPESLTDFMRDFLFGAYRFHYLSRAREDFPNPFDQNPYLLEGAFTSAPYLFPEEDMLRLASFFSKEHHYVAAGNTYERLVIDEGLRTGEAWRGIAVTRMIRKDYRGALEALYNAMEAEGMTVVTVTKACDILSHLEDKNEIIALITRAEAEIDDVSIATLIERKSILLREQGAVDKALEAAFKAVYLTDRKSESAVLTLAKTLMVAGRASDAYDQLQEGEDSEEKRWMSGIAQIAMGQRNEGLSHLRDIGEGTLSRAEKRDLLDLLHYYDIQPWESALMLDTILMKDDGQ